MSTDTTTETAESGEVEAPLSGWRAEHAAIKDAQDALQRLLMALEHCSHDDRMARHIRSMTFGVRSQLYDLSSMVLDHQRFG